MKARVPKYDIIYTDPPWPMYGDKNKNAAAGKHYELMTLKEIIRDNPRRFLRDPEKGAFFVWATCPRLDLALTAIAGWGLHYRGVAFVWIKTRKDGKPIGAQGIPPTSVKPTTELCLFASTHERGRPFPLKSSSVKQVVFSPRGAHSEKPSEVRERIIEIYGDRPRLEMYARKRVRGWDSIGNELKPL